MGRTITPKYKVRIAQIAAVADEAGWPTRDAGRPTDQNLARYVEVLNASMQPGGCNDHLNPDRYTAIAAVVAHNHHGGSVVAHWPTRDACRAAGLI